MIISFAWTTPAFKARQKTVTRRDWSDEYAAKFHKYDVVEAYSRQTSFGGVPIGKILIKETPYREWSNLVPEIDFEKEGFLFLEMQKIKCGKLTPMQVWEQWFDEPELLYVVRFEIIEVF
ncbi:MAG: hypothetical protein EPO24_07705 [Bacteroidetes bacterium]|nr:MAG: hypothetical protein EPO24_07705 [Bacteroidota bacterium]